MDDDRPNTLPHQLTWRAGLGYFLLIALICALAFSNTILYPFVGWDDNELIVENPLVRGGLRCRNVLRIFTAPQISYLPLRTLSYAIDYSIWGLNTVGYHLVNILFHALTAFMVFCLARRHFARGADTPTRARSAALLAALLFALHPIHVESVTWLSGRKDVLSAFLLLLSLHCYLDFASARGKHGFARYVVALVSFQCAVLTKATTVVLPLLLLLCDYCWLPRSRSTRRRLLDVMPFFVLAGIAVLLSMSIAQWSGAIKTYRRDSFGLTMLATSKVLVDYLARLLVPINLSVRYPVDLSSSLAAPYPLLCLAAVALLFLLPVLAARRSKPTLLWSGWYLICLLPVLNLVPTSTLAADRYLYLPSIGFCIALAAALNRLAAKGKTGGREVLASGVMLAVLALYLFGTTARNRAWSGSVALWQDAVTKVPHDSLPRYNLGCFYVLDKRYDAALSQLNRALARPLSDRSKADVHCQIGRALHRKKGYSAAEQRFQKAIALDPNHAFARFSLALLYKERYQYDRATRQLEIVTRIEPDYADACYQLALLRRREGKRDEAVRLLERTIHLYPDHSPARRALLAIKPAAQR